MKNFDDWYKELTSDERWFEQAGMNHKPETFKDVALKVYTNGMTDSLEFAQTPLKFHRQHVFNKLCKVTPDKVRKPWYLPKEEPKKDEKPPLTGEARAKRLQEWMDALAKLPAMKTAPISSRELIENGDWRPKPVEIREPTEMEKRTAYLAHVEMVRRCRVKYFRDAYPDAMDDEVQAYLAKFEKIDNPLGL
jgi:hypothetical protein